MPDTTPHIYYCVYFKFKGKDGALAGSGDFIIPSENKPRFHEIEAKAEEVIMAFFSDIFPDVVMDVMPIPDEVKIIQGRIIHVPNEVTI